MEWGHIYQNTFGNCPQSDFSELVHLFYAGGYLPFNPGTMEPLSDTDRDQSSDIGWVHSSAIQLSAENSSRKP